MVNQNSLRNNNRGNKEKLVERVILYSFCLCFFAVQIFLTRNVVSWMKKEPILQKTVRIGEEEWTLSWDTNSPRRKPIVYLRSNPVIEVDASLSSISLSGKESLAFWLHPFSFSFDENSIYSSYSGIAGKSSYKQGIEDIIKEDVDYTIEQVARVEKGGVRIQFFLSPPSEENPLGKTDVSLAFRLWPGSFRYIENESLLIVGAPIGLLGGERISKVKIFKKPDSFLIEEKEEGKRELKFFITYNLEKIEKRVLLTEIFIFE